MTDAEKRLVDFCLDHVFCQGPDGAHMLPIDSIGPQTLAFLQEMEALKLAIYLERKSPEAMNLLEGAWVKREEGRDAWKDAREEVLQKFGESVLSASVNVLLSRKKIG